MIFLFFITVPDGSGTIFQFALIPRGAGQVRGSPRASRGSSAQLSGFSWRFLVDQVLRFSPDYAGEKWFAKGEQQSRVVGIDIL